ncbi:YceI family protein [Sphingobium sp. EM0848]|uniref:YceI family protein n=1 Tax=Sphingobium sp. EM0848 TaxID=2743473 RepID=UPI00159C9C7F|nr:YceI family protein [Sphingobium sp. EM0848]
MIRLIVATPLATLSLAMAAPVHGEPPKSTGVPAWNVDQAHSKLGFVGAMNGQSFNGQFRRWSAQIRFDPARLNGSTVHVAIETNSAVTGDQTRDEALPTPDWFSARLFPRATFTSQRFVSLGGNSYRVDGVLRIRDVTRPVSFPFQLAIQGNSARMSARMSIDRTIFGVGQGQFKGTDAVAAKVDVVIAITASKAK